MIILVITIICQALIVQFGSVVFGIDPNGLSAANWGISLALGSGTILVGFAVRLLPEIQFPSFGVMSKLDDAPKEKDEGGVVVEIPANVEKPPAERVSQKIITVFGENKSAGNHTPPQASNQSSVAPVHLADPSERRKASIHWDSLRKHTLSGTFRRRDIAHHQMLSSSAIKTARMSQSVRNSN